MEIRAAFKSDSRIVFNGREFRSPDQMSEDVRRQYQDAIALAAKGGPNVKVSSQTEIVINGRRYAGVADMSPDDRPIYEDLMKKVDANRNGVPDALEGGARRLSPFSILSRVTLIALVVWLVIILLRSAGN